MGLSSSRQTLASDSMEFRPISPMSSDPPPYRPHTAPGRGRGGSSGSPALSDPTELNVPPPAYFSQRDSEHTLLPSYSPPLGRDLEHGLRRENINDACCRWPVTRVKILKGLAALGLVVGLLTVAVVIAKFDREPDPPR